MSVTARTGKGIVFKRSGTALAEVLGVDGPNKSRDVHDVTDTDSADNHRVFIGGLVDGGTVSLPLHFLGSAAQQTLEADMENVESVSYAIEFPFSTVVTCTFNGLLQSTSIGAPIDDKMTLDCEFKVSGKPVWS